MKKTHQGILIFMYAILVQFPLAASADEVSAERILGDVGIKKGVCVILGAQNSKLAMDLSRQGQFLIQVLDTDPAKIKKAREAIKAQGLYGSRLSVLQSTFTKLPYPDHFVNLIIVMDSGLSGLNASEIRRILRPKNIAWIGINDNALKQSFAADKQVNIEEKKGVLLVTRLRPDGMGDWGYQMYNASGNPVSDDQFAGPPFRTQWVAGPVKNSGGHYGGISVIANGRVFYFDYRQETRNKVGSISQQIPTGSL